MIKPLDKNTLFYGDNLPILREHIADESVDLIYLDPPFNSNASYNVLFKAPDGHQSHAQIEAFDDTWSWGPSAQLAYDDVIESENSDAAEMLRSIRMMLGDNAMMAYLAMMAVRIIELKRVLKKSGSIYLHCDPTASHYLKILLDSVFGASNFLNEIIWRRTGSHNNAKRFGPIHDVILFYQASDSYVHKPVFQPYLMGHVRSYFKKKDKVGAFWTNSLTGAGTRKGESGQVWRGYDPTSRNRHWAIPGSIIEELGIDPNLKTLAKLDALADAGFVDFPKDDSIAMPTYKQYLHSSPGMLLQDIWAYQPHTQGCVFGNYKGIDEDVRWLTAQGDKERLGYPTQKPVGLLERILAASTNEGYVVLDPFCGCGTTLHAATKMNRHWIGIDITHLSIGLIKKRLVDSFPYVKFDTYGVPKDIGGARALSAHDKYEFQRWLLSMVAATPFKGGKKGGDGGVDGIIYFKPDGKNAEKAIISVKGGETVTPAMIKDLIVTVERQGAKMGIFLTLTPPTKGMVAEAAAAGFYKTEYGSFKKIQILSVQDLFDGKKPHMPWIDNSMFKKARREPTAFQKDLDL